jgi:hypothetical protein
MEIAPLDNRLTNDVDFKKGFLCDLEEDFAKHVGQLRKINNDGSFEFAKLTNWHTTIRDHNSSSPKLPKCNALSKRISNSNSKLHNSISRNNNNNNKALLPNYLSPDSKKTGGKHKGSWQLSHGWKNRPQNLQVDVSLASENIKIYSQRIEKARSESKNGGFGSEIRPCSPYNISPPKSPNSSFSPLKISPSSRSTSPSSMSASLSPLRSPSLRKSATKHILF